MPKVPVYSTPQVRTGSLQGGTRSLTESQSAKALGMIGQVGQVAYSQYEKSKNEADQIRVEDARNQLMLQDAKDQTAVGALRGEQVLKPREDGSDPTSDISAQRREALDAIRQSLGNDRQRQEFDRYAGQHNAKMGVFVEAHKAREQEAYSMSVHADTLLIAKEEFSKAAVDPEQAKYFAQYIKESTAALHPGQETTGLQAKAVSEAALGVVRDAVNNRQMVTGRLDHLAELMTEDDKATMAKISKVSDAATQGLQIAREAFSANPKMSAEDLTKLADEAAGDNVDLQHAIMAEGEQRLQAQRAAQAKRDSDLKGDFVFRLTSGKLSSASARAEIAALDVNGGSLDAKGDLSQYLQNWSKAQREDPRVLTQDYLTFVTNPRLGSLTREEVLRAASSLGGHAADAVSRWQSASANGALPAIPDAVKSAVITHLKAAGDFDPKSADDMAALNQAVIQAHDKFSAESQGTGKYATARPTDAEMYNEVLLRTKSVVTEPRWYGDRKVRPAVATGDQLRDFVVNMPKESRALADRYLSDLGVASRDPRTLLEASNKLETLKIGNRAAYDILWRNTFPRQRTAATMVTSPGSIQ